jgi:hypothetical protein
VYPTPFNPLTRFTLEILESESVTIHVFDVLGRRVATLHEGLLSESTKHAFTFDASNHPTGLYLITAIGETFHVTKKVLLVK